MTKRNHLLLASLKRCQRFLLDHPTLLGAVCVSPPARDLGDAIAAMEVCGASSTTLRAIALPFVVRQSRSIRKGLDDLVRPIVREDRVLAERWAHASVIERRRNS